MAIIRADGAEKLRTCSITVHRRSCCVALSEIVKLSRRELQVISYVSVIMRSINQVS